MFLAYSIVAAACTVHDVVQRYYGPDTGSYVTTAPPTSLGKAVGAMWSLQDATYLFAPTQEPFDFSRGTPVEAIGSALDARGGGAASVAMLLDERQPLQVLARQYLFAIAEAAHSTAAGYSGFNTVIDTSHLAYGAHVVSAYARSASGEPYRAIRPSRVFFVTLKGGRMPVAFMQLLRRAPHATLSLEPLEACRGATHHDGAVTTVARGTVLLVRGTLSANRLSRYRAAWLLAGDRPFAAKVDGNVFVALLPTKTLLPGDVAISLYAQRFAPKATTSLGSFALRVTPSNVLPPRRADAPAECADPLRELAQE